MIIIGYLLINDTRNKSSIHSDNIFHVNEISKITKIFLSDREGNTIELVKDKYNWIVNKKYTVREDAIKTLLETINKIRIKHPVSNSASENVIKYIATTGINVEIFAEDQLIKSYIIGSSTPDHLGTYMIIKNTKKPYVIHMPTFNGFLSPRYGIQNNILNENSWRSTKVFNLQANKIEQIKYSDLLNPHNSYYLTTKPIIMVLDHNNKEINYNNKKIQKLLNSFKNLNCETYKNEKKKLIESQQVEELIVNSDTLKIYQISNSIVKKKNENYTVKRKFATLNDGDIMLIQDYVFNKVLIKLDEIKN